MQVLANRRVLTATFLLVLLMLIAIGCDIFEDEKEDWKNEVTIRIFNESNCLVDIKIDGNDVESLNPGENFEENDLGRGIHVLEAYPWNDAQFSCASQTSPALKTGEEYEWTITTETGCGQCEPTPTPEPATPTPTPSA